MVEGDLERPVGGEVQVGEEDLVRAKPPALGLERFLHLHDEIGPRPNIGLRSDNFGSLRGILLVADAAAGLSRDDRASGT